MKKIILIAFFSVLLLSCKKEKNHPVIDGIYQGSFEIVSNAGLTSGNTIVTFDKGNFTCKTENNNILFGGSGIYTLDSKTINLKDMNARIDLYSYNLLLNGIYTYSFDGSELKIFTQKNTGYYELNLVKQ